MQGVGIQHDSRPLLRDITLDVPEGESLCLIGASGSGKSLIAAAVMGLLPDCMEASGCIGLGRSLLRAGDQPGLRGQWSTGSCLVPQEPAMALAPLLALMAQLRLPSTGAAALTREAGAAWLARFGLDRTAARGLQGNRVSG